MTDQRPLPYVTPASSPALAFPLSIDMPDVARAGLGATNYLMWACAEFQGAPGLVARGSAPFDSVRLDPLRSSPHAVIAVEPYGASGNPHVLTPGAVARFPRPVDSVRVWNPLQVHPTAAIANAARANWYGGITLEGGTDLRESEGRPIPGALGRASMIQVLAASFGAFTFALPPPGRARRVRISAVCTENTPPAYSPVAAPADLSITLTGAASVQAGQQTTALSAATRIYAPNANSRGYYAGYTTAGAMRTDPFRDLVHGDASITLDATRNVAEREINAPGLASLWFNGVIVGTGLDSVYLVGEYL